MSKYGKREKLQDIRDYLVSIGTLSTHSDWIMFLEDEIILTNKKNNCHKRVTVKKGESVC